MLHISHQSLLVEHNALGVPRNVVLQATFLILENGHAFRALSERTLPCTDRSGALVAQLNLQPSGRVQVLSWIVNVIKIFCFR